MAVQWKFVEKQRVQYSPETPPTVFECIKLSAPQEHKRIYGTVLSGQTSQRLHSGTLLVALDQATLTLPEEHKNSPAKPYAIVDFDKSQVRVDSSYSGTPEQPKWTGFPRALTKFWVSGANALMIHVYLPTTGSDEQDVPLGFVRLQPDFEAENQERQFALRWLDLSTGGSVRVGAEYVPSMLTEPGERQVFLRRPHPRYEAMDVGVFALQEWKTDRVYAVRTIRKTEAQDAAYYDQVARRVDHPFIATLLFSLKSADEVYLFSPLVYGGHLFYYLQMEGRFDLQRSTQYAGEILCALDYIHSLDMDLDYYGRLRPANIRLDSIGHIVICDFGLHLGQQEPTTIEEDMELTECPSPELLLNGPRTKTTDWWTLGSILYEMLLGVPPFLAEDRQAMYSKILANEPLRSPESSTFSEDAKDLLRRLLCRPEQRLGVNGAWEIKEHPFFQSLDWDRLSRGECTPAFKPSDFGPTMKFSSNKTEESKRMMRAQFSNWGAEPETTHPIEPRQPLEPTPFEAKLAQSLRSLHSNPATDSITRTQLLSLAVDRCDLSTAKRLLAEGVQPDFPATIHPTAHHLTPSNNWTQDHQTPSERDKYLPPLARAVGWRNVELARVLLEAGADANVGFHCYSDPGTMGHGAAFRDVCGRVVQLAMLLGDEEMVGLLGAFGADVWDGWPRLKGHRCTAFERRSWFGVVAGLERCRELGTSDTG